MVVKSKPRNNGNKRKTDNIDNYNNVKKPNVAKGNCWNCGDAGHHKRDCKSKQQREQAYVTSDEYFTDVVFETNMDDDDERWIDFGATRHIARKKSLFQTYDEVEYGHNLSKGNFISSKVVRKGKGVIHLSMDKLILNDVFHVLEI